MTPSSRTGQGNPKKPRKPAHAAAGARAKASPVKRAKTSATNQAIATKLAPAVAIALLEKMEQEPGAAAPALDCLGAGATASETEGMVRVQLMFENGAVLPLEMTTEAGEALAKGLAAELPKK